jgi:hypothetical protein
MNRPSGEQPNFLDWEAFQKWFGPQNSFPNLPQSFWKDPNLSWLNEYMQQIMAQVLRQEEEEEQDTERKKAEEPQAVSQPEAGGAGSANRSNYQVFETHQTVIARIPVTSRLEAAKIKVFAGTSQIRIEGLANGRKQIFQLPSPIDFNQAKAVYKDQVLEVRAPKEPNEPYKQINVQLM